MNRTAARSARQLPSRWPGGRSAIRSPQLWVSRGGRCAAPLRRPRRSFPPGRPAHRLPGRSPGWPPRGTACPGVRSLLAISGPAGRPPAPGPRSPCRWPRPRPAPAAPSAPARLGQQPRIGGVGHIRRDHRGICPHPRRAQKLVLGGLRPQRLVQPGHRLFPAPGGQLHQRRGMRDLPIERDPAKLSVAVRKYPQVARLRSPVLAS